MLNYAEEIKRLEKELAEIKAKMNGVEVIHQSKNNEILPNEDWDVGDIIRFTLLTGEAVEAQCQKVEDGKAIFCLTHCLKNTHVMDDDSNVGEWEDTQLRHYLNGEILDSFPDVIKTKMKPIYKSDLLTLPSMQDMFGDWDCDNWKPKSAGLNNRNWTLMQHEQYRAKGRWWWLRDSYSTSSYGYYWCRVDTSGASDLRSGCRAYGLAPAFAI